MVHSHTDLLYVQLKSKARLCYLAETGHKGGVGQWSVLYSLDINLLNVVYATRQSENNATSNSHPSINKPSAEKWLRSVGLSTASAPEVTRASTDHRFVAPAPEDGEHVSL